ncbi:MAG: hypothetical protein KF909_09920 [Rhodocyclaceae bacterium]|nr:hypothetical protein [Rhodocyclaceae bacterium]MCW5617183.1 hypothetical protein [Rhodocyclaceae bacterium]
MTESIPLGTRKVIDGQDRTYYYGYWIKAYDPPADTLKAKKRLIEGLTRRLFNHVEHGLNIPGARLEEARASYDTEVDPARKRVKGAMLAGALFNRATDIFTKLVELQALGVEIQSDNQLMRECGRCLQDALTLGRLVQHRSGEEGIDELWGEPFKAFTMPIDAFYESRYVKIAMTMRDIDRITEALIETLGGLDMFGPGIAPHLRAYADAAKIKCETLRTDPAIFDVWSTFVVAAQQVTGFAPLLPIGAADIDERETSEGKHLIQKGVDLISYITRARVPMPKSTQDFLDSCDTFYRAASGRRQANNETL